MSSEKQWYYNIKTQQPEFGMVSPAEVRMGPYATKEDAIRAMEIVRERNLAWEKQDRSWNA
ncbi:MAG: hypothetical protein Q3961_02295 [Bifidobacteriaceae bacterium]|nr:hypothetical protein [Bifidobacteriaceae bacterium]